MLIESGKIWYMLKNCCQSFLNGANGSNACMIIALLAGHAISGTDDLHNDISIDTIMASILSSFLGCIDIENTLYNMNNLNGYLDIVQGITAIGHSIGFEILLENNAYLHQPPLFTEMLEVDLTGFPESSFVIMVVGGKNFAILLRGKEFIMVDSHSNREYGAKIVHLEEISSLNLVLDEYAEDEVVYYACVASREV